MTEEERIKLRKKYGITLEDERSYEIPEEQDYEILSKVKELETKDLSIEDKETVDLIRSQLIAKWRNPLLQKLNILLKKY